jgi:DNA-3-methyladenine glycosylase
MYHCLNVVAEKEGSSGCVLIRAIEPVENVASPGNGRAGNGPGKLTRALGITLQHYGADLTQGPLTIREPATKSAPFKIGVSPRIGIREAVDWPLRFFVTENPHVSRRR